MQLKFQKRQSKASPGDYSLTILPLSRARLYLLATSGVTDQDDVITDLINAAVQFIEAGLDFSIDTSGLITQYYDYFPSDGELPIWHRYITTTDLVVQYWDDTTWQTFSSANYRIDTWSAPPKVFLKSDAEWPTDVSDDINSVRVSFKMDTSHSFLDDVKAAAMAFVAHRYENRENTNSIPDAVMAVINRHKIHS